MINRFLLFACALLFTFSAQARSNAEIFEGKAAHEIVPGSELVRMKAYTSIPNYIRFRAGSEIPFAEFENWMKRFYKNDPAFGFKLLMEQPDKMGYIHYRYRQTYNNVPLEWGTWIVHVKNGMIVSMNGELFDKVNVSSPALSEASALNHALNHVGASTYKWEVPAEESHLKWETNDPNATYYPHGEVVIMNRDETMKVVDLRTAYKFNVYAHQPMGRSELFVDAVSGDILFENELIHHADSNGTANTGYSGQQAIVSDYTGIEFRLRETGRGNGVETFDMNQGTSYGNSVDFTDDDNFWNNFNQQVDEYATDAHWGAEMTYDYYFQQHGRNSIDGNGFTLRSYIHYDQNFGNAFWDGQRMTYGDGNNGNNPYTTIDIAAHEVTHGLTTFTANLIYQNESGALNESFSDIFGISVDEFADPNGFNWTLGEQLGFTIRNMANPNALNDPDTYFGNFWFTGPGDNGGVHTNSGVQNFWYYLLVTGGSGTNDNGDAYNVNGIGFDDAGEIAFRNLVFYLTNNSQYSDARFFAIQSAMDIFGPCTPEVESTIRAWYAVGIGPDYVAGVNADFITTTPTSCTTPLTVDFTNFSTNATSYSWDFGDGNTSTQVSPIHTYINTGTYTVTLIVSSSCGADTLEMIDLIELGPDVPCVVDMPTSGTGTVQTNCDGVIYDPGGANANYPDNTDSEITITPFGAGSVTLNIVEFDIEAGDNGTCNFDYIEFFDGPSTSSTSLGRYCNTTGNPGTITSTSSSITVVHHSDGGLNRPGYKIEWTCNPPTSPPVVDFSPSVTSSCSGIIAFTDESTNGPTSWAWEFGDGGTSTMQNPTHVYSASGLYTVKLTATNIIGSTSETKTSLVAVNLPESPIGEDIEICPNESTTLSATSNGTVEWYDAPTGGNLLATGPSYTTPVLTQSTGYYAQTVIPGIAQSLGAVDIGIGTGSFFNFNSNQYLIFDAYQEFKLESVDVWSGSDGDRIIQLRDNNGVVIEQTTVNIQNGQHTVLLNFTVPVGTEMQLGIAQGTTIDLYRNNSGPNYPYELAGMASILRSSANQNPFGFYYYFYNWQISEICTSDREEIIASMAVCTGVEEIENVSEVTVFPNPIKEEFNVSLQLNQTEEVTIELTDMSGRVIRSLYQQELTSGSHTLTFTNNDLANGVYYCKIRTDHQQVVRKVVTMR